MSRLFLFAVLSLSAFGLAQAESFGDSIIIDDHLLLVDTDIFEDHVMLHVDGDVVTVEIDAAVEASLDALLLPVDEPGSVPLLILRGEESAAAVYGGDRVVVDGALQIHGASGVVGADLQLATADPCDGFCDGLCLDGECYMDLPQLHHYVTE